MNNSIAEHENRLHHIETKIDDMCMAHNEEVEVDILETQDAEIMWLKANVADLKDRGHVTNVKLRGVPKSILPKDITLFIQQLLKTLLPHHTEIDLLIDRDHRIPKTASIARRPPERHPRENLFLFSEGSFSKYHTENEKFTGSIYSYSPLR